MKKYCLLSLAILISSIVVAQDSDFEPGKVKVTAKVLNVRNIPSAGGVIVLSLQRGDVVETIDKSKSKVEIDGFSDYWYKVKAKNKTGWVFGAYVSFDINLEGGLRWKSVNPSYGKNYLCVAVSDNGTVYTGCSDGSVYLSNEGPKAWKKLTPQALGVSIGRINNIAITESGMWIAASGDKNGGIWKSSNEGGAWTQYTVSQGLLSNNVTYVCEDSKGVVYAATSKGLCVSKDGGLNWNVYPEDRKMKGISCVAVYGTSVFVGTDDGLYVCANPQGKWERIGKKESNMGDKIYTIAASSKGEIYVGTDMGLTKCNVADLKKWQAIGGRNSVNKILSDASGKIYVATDNGLNISIDNGISWITYKKENGIADNKVIDLSISKKDGTVWITSGNSGLSYNE